MKAWVLWHRYSDGSGATILRVHLDERRANEDHDLVTAQNALSSDEYDLTETAVYGCPFVEGDVRDPVRAAAYDLLEACEALVAADAVPELDALPKTETAIGNAAKLTYAAIAKVKGEGDGR